MTTELRRLAEAATPGPWVTEQATSNLVPVYVSSSATCEAVCMMDGGDMPQRHKDAAYIAAMHPETTLALLDRLAELEALLEQARMARTEYRALLDRIRDIGNARK